jgi:dienelactone hydrolase
MRRPTRRDVIRASGLTGAAIVGGFAQQQSPNKSELNYREYFRCLPDALGDFASGAFEIRNAQLQGGLNTRARMQDRQRWARETFWFAIGGQPANILEKRKGQSAHIRSTGRLERQRYTVEKLVYEGRPGEWISANLYVPKTGAAPFPGVLFQAGHTKNGKAGHTYQSCCQGLAQLGFLVLTFDPIGQGERTNYPGPNGLTRFPSADDEHTVPGRQLLLVGETMTRLQLEDAITSLDVLASHPKVDPKRLGAAGQSGGGTLTMMLVAVDDRITAAVVCSGNTENVACGNFHPPGSVDDAEQNFIGTGPLGFDRWDLLWPFAPRPLLILASAMDFFHTYSPNYIQNGREEYRRLADVYSALGHPDQLHYYEHPLPHALSYAMRLELYRWSAKWLQDERRPIDNEPPVAPEPDSELWATHSGSVTRELGSATPFALARARAAQIQTPAAQADLRKILAISDRDIRPRLDVLSTVPSTTCKIVAAEVCTAPRVWIPMWVFIPHGQTREMIIILDPSGRNAHWQDGELYQTLGEKVIVCAPDLRGIGDLRPEYSRGAPDYAGTHETDEAYAWGSLIFGRPLLGQQVQDLLAVISAVRDHFGSPPLALLAARESLTIPALCAAALNPDVTHTHLSDHLATWRSITETEDYNASFSNFVPGILTKTDLPHIAASIAPRRVTLAGCVDAAGMKLPDEKVDELYASSNVLRRAAENWDAEALLSLL